MSKKIIIIGGGVSGLTAGIYALQAGFVVELYESHRVLGGMCAQWQRKEALCTSAIHWMMGTKAGSDLHEIWKNIGAINPNADIFTLDYISACKNGNEYCYLYADIQKLESELLQLSPQDEEVVKELIREINVYRKLPIPADKPMDLMAPMEKAIRFAPYMKAAKQTSLHTMPIVEYVKRFQSPVIRRLLLSVVPDARLYADMLMMWLAASCNGDIAFPKNGFYAMAKRMEERFVSLGGKIYTNSPVKKITVEGETATSIVLADGGEASADYIIPTQSPNVLLEQLLDNQFHDTYFEQRITDSDRFLAPALTLVNLNIKADMNPFPHTLAIETQQPIRINAKEISRLKINHYAFAPCFCKNGKTLVQAVLQEQEFDYWNALKTASETQYRQAKEAIAQQIIQEIEMVYPATKGTIELLDVATPLTVQRYCHTYRGAYLSFCATYNQAQRENHEGMINGINNMYPAGQWVFQDGGLPSAAIAGKFAVQRICNKENNNIIS